MYLKTRRQRILFTGKLESWDWTLRRDTPENFQEGKKGNPEAPSKKATLMSKILARPVLRNNHLRKPHDKQVVPAKVAWNLATKCASLSRTWNNVLFSCEGARDTEGRMFIVYLGSSVHNAKQGELSTHTMDTLSRSKTPYATYRDWGQCKETSKHKFFFFFHDLDLFATEQLLDKAPAILLLLYTLLKTRRFIWVENGETPQLAKNGKTTTWKMDNSERSNARHSVWLQTFTVNLEDLERCARTFLWKSDLRFGRWCFKSGDTKTEA